MFTRISTTLLAAALAAPFAQAQFNFDIDGKPVQIHSFGSQGFMASDQNNYLTTNTSKGSFDFTDIGGNISMRLTDNFRIGAQIYDREIGQLGAWHPQLDWAVADYRVKDWFGVRGGVVKTVFGLHNDTQDVDFLQTYALLPQSVYPTDLRDALIRHRGGDVYGNVSLGRLGSLAYTGFAGLRVDSLYGGYIYLLHGSGIFMNSYGGLQYGGDLKWTTPIKGLVLGASRMNEDITGKGTYDASIFGGPKDAPYEEHSLSDWANQFYGQYSIGNLTLEAEYRRWYRYQDIFNGFFTVTTDTRTWYADTSYRLSKRFTVGGYYSHFVADWGTAHFYPGNHLYDKVLTLRADLKNYWDVKVEGHFMNGTGGTGIPGGGLLYPDGFYPFNNPAGLKPTTTLLVVKTGFNF
ncbi:MAG TPA: hypothetical protein VFW44_11205 [Bryobacteraceae bacterium]|nr:hypothetical protein [Bryobacteraceae bacterium]